MSTMKSLSELLGGAENQNSAVSKKLHIRHEMNLNRFVMELYETGIGTDEVSYLHIPLKDVLNGLDRNVYITAYATAHENADRVDFPDYKMYGLSEQIHKFVHSAANKTFEGACKEVNWKLLNDYVDEPMFLLYADHNPITRIFDKTKDEPFILDDEHYDVFLRRLVEVVGAVYIPYNFKYVNLKTIFIETVEEENAIEEILQEYEHYSYNVKWDSFGGGYYVSSPFTNAYYYLVFINFTALLCQDYCPYVQLTKYNIY